MIGAIAPSDQVKVVNERSMYCGRVGTVLDVHEDRLAVWVNVFLPEDDSAYAGVTPGPAVTGIMFLATELAGTGQMRLGLVGEQA